MKNIEKIFIFYLVILQILVIIRNIQIGNFQLFLYVCNHIPLLIIIFLLYKKYDLLKSLINIGFLIQIGWILDFLSKLIFNFYLFGATKYIFENSNYFSIIVSILIHTSTLIPLFFLIKKEKTSKKSVYYSTIYISILYFLGLFFTNPIYDINCIFYAYNINFLQFNYFTWFYLPLIFILVILPTYWLQKKCEL